MRDFLALLHIFEAKKVNKQERSATIGIFLLAPRSDRVGRKMMNDDRKAFLSQFYSIFLQRKKTFYAKKSCIKFSRIMTVYMYISVYRKRKKAFLQYLFGILTVYIIGTPLATRDGPAIFFILCLFSHEKKALTILKEARERQQVLSSQEPLTPWHLHSTFMFFSSICNTTGTRVSTSRK